MEFDTIELTHELGHNFVNYAMAVNTDRSIPDATTGLKPVHKRILYCALDDGNTSNKKYIKCANNVGSMLANWHPHGDSSVYGALVRLSQPWVMRYPLIDFHGNNGNEGGDPPAHYRYTECRLAKISEDGILNGVKKHAVEFQPNFDETKQEPVNLPAVFPNLLCNPNGGIGVTLACSWAPHNLNEVANAIYDYLDGKEPTLPGPDFPTGGIIINKDDIPKIMETGKGSVKIRAKYKIEGNSLIFYELPYGLLTEDVIKQLNSLADEEKLDGVTEIRDDSDKHAVQVTLECRKDANFNKIISTVYQSTSMQSSFSYNQVALVDKVPILLNLKQCIQIYVKHNLACIVREHKFELSKKQERLEIVNGLLKALEDIDNIITLIKASNTSTQAKESLISKYNFTELQAQAIVDMKLGKLAGLEKIELQQEKKNLEEDIKHLTFIISDVDTQTSILRDKLSKIVKTYGDARRTELTQIAVDKKEKEIVMVEPEDCVVIVSTNNFVKRIPLKSYKVQKRNTVGVKNNGDIIAFSQKTNTIDTLMIFSSKGKMYRVLVDNIPEGSNTSPGVPISSLVTFEDNEVPMAYTTLTRDTDKKFIFFATKKGIVKKVPLEDYDKMKRTGIIALTLKEGDSLAAITFINQEQMMLLTKNGMCIRFETSKMPISSRIAQGVKGMNVSDGDEIITALPIINNADYLAIVSVVGLGKKIKLQEFTIQNRGGKGISCYKEEIVGGVIINDENKLIISGDKTSIMIDSKEVPCLNR